MECDPETKEKDAQADSPSLASAPDTVQSPPKQELEKVKTPQSFTVGSYILKHTVDVHAESSTHSNVLAELERGTEIEVIGLHYIVDEGRLRGLLVSPMEGWISLWGFEDDHSCFWYTE